MEQRNSGNIGKRSFINGITLFYATKNTLPSITVLKLCVLYCLFCAVLFEYMEENGENGILYQFARAVIIKYYKQDG